MNLHDIIAAVAAALTRMKGNAAEAFTTQVGDKAKAWEALKPLYTDMSKAWATVPKNAGKVYTAKTFTEAVAKRAADEGETWEYTEDEVRGLIAFRKHNAKTEAGYKTYAAGKRIVPHIDGYTAHLVDIDKGFITNTGNKTSERETKLAENAANRKTKLETARAAIDISTFYGTGDDLKAKLAKARKIRDAALMEIQNLEAEITRQAAARKATAPTS